jgi:hypothetical protein
MMSKEELIEWRNQEQSRLPAIVKPQEKRVCNLVISILNAVLQDD